MELIEFVLVQPSYQLGEEDAISNELLRAVVQKPSELIESCGSLGHVVIMLEFLISIEEDDLRLSSVHLLIVEEFLVLEKVLVFFMSHLSKEL